MGSTAKHGPQPDIISNLTLHEKLEDAYEQNPTAFGDRSNIPESGNGVPDLLDEIKWLSQVVRSIGRAKVTIEAEVSDKSK